MCYGRYKATVVKSLTLEHRLIIIIIIIIFSHLADAFIQSDLQMRTTEAINCSIETTKNRSKTKS